LAGNNYLFIKVLEYNVDEMNSSEEKRQDITEILRQWSSGDREALDELMPLVYEELHRQAAQYLRRERSHHTLQTTALINEAYLKLIDQRDVNWENRTHFFAIAAQAMRRILVDYAKTRNREKRGGAAENLPLDDAFQIQAKEENSVDLIALDEALTRLAEIDEQQARVVELRYFADLSLEATAETLHISRATAARDWSVAKAWLLRELSR
jgi:RNA polymerase sigma factor (TIGR02999 family)